jgi:hypothetical protein
MALTSNVFLGQPGGQMRVQMGSRTGTRSAADFTITLGFKPKYLRVINLEDRIEAEWFGDANLDSTSSNLYALKTIADGTRSYEDVGFTVYKTEGASGRQFTVTVATAGLETDDDDVAWIAMGD